MMFAPLEGWRRVKVTDRRAAVDYAHALKDLSDMHFPGADKIVLVQDNLSTHRAASLYEAFPAAEPRRHVERFEGHYTPKHGSGLDMAESELASSRPNASIAASPTRRLRRDPIKPAHQQNRTRTNSCGSQLAGVAATFSSGRRGAAP